MHAKRAARVRSQADQRWFECSVLSLTYLAAESDALASLGHDQSVLGYGFYLRAN